MANMPVAEWKIDELLVVALLDDQFPDLAGLAVTPLANGWDNVMFRLGTELTVRLPRREAAVALIGNEQRCLEVLAPQLPIPVPVSIRRGVPSDRFPMPWSVCRWLPGVLAADATFTDRVREAKRLGGFLNALHRPAPDDAPSNEWRGHDVRLLAPRVRANLERVDLGPLYATEQVMRRFATLVDVAAYDGPPLWLHGDLHAANVLVDDGAISAVIDFGDITSGDPAVDLAIGWMVFDRSARQEFRRSMSHVDDATWSRGAAWALHFSLIFLANSGDNARLDALGQLLLSAVLDDELA